MIVRSKYVSFGLMGLICLLFAGLLIGASNANKLLSSRAQLSLKAKTEALAQEQQSYLVAKQNIKKYADLEQIAKTIVPQDKSQAEAVREIVNLAAKNKVSLSSIDFPPSSLGGNASVATPAGSANAPASSLATNSSKNSQNKLSQLAPVPGIPGVYQLTITVTSDPQKPVTYSQLISFLHDLEENRRTAQVTTINIQPLQGSTSQLTFIISLNEYIKP
jgi:hypothetical protein